MNKKLRFGIITSAIVLAAIIAGVFFGVFTKEVDIYEYTTIQLGDLTQVISYTGTLKTKGTVELSTQVSGTVSDVYTDFNKIVRKGELLAKLDTRILENNLAQAEADLIRSNAQYDQVTLDFESKSILFKDGLISEYEYKTAKATRDAGYANKVSANVNLEKAKTNLDYAYIRSPINGVVIDKNVETGQTVAASFSAPVLFVLAESLKEMEIHALVDESEIHRIYKGMKCLFSIESDPLKFYEATVHEVRLNPESGSDVVNYKVVINCSNEEGILLPGMTASIDFILAERINVPSIESQALRVVPTSNMEKKLSKKPSLSKASNSAQANNAAPVNNGRRARRPDYLWVLNEQQEFERYEVGSGVVDGRRVELLNLPEGYENWKVVLSVTTAKKATKKNNSAPTGFGAGRGPRMF